MTARVRRVQLATGVTLSFVESGDARQAPVVLLHPWAESSRCFSGITALLSGVCRTVAVDLRGHGDSDKPDHGYGLSSLADDVVAVLDALALDAAVLLGCSSGGYVAQQVALRHPGRVAGLVLVGSPRSLQGRAPFADEVDRLTDPVPAEWVRASLTWFPLVQPVPDSYLEDRVRDGLQMPAAVWRLSLAGLCGAVPPTDQGVITARTLIISGAEDALLGHDDLAALLLAIPGSRSLRYPGTGHLVHWERPDWVAADVRQFLERAGSEGWVAADHRHDKESGWPRPAN